MTFNAFRCDFIACIFISLYAGPMARYQMLALCVRRALCANIIPIDCSSLLYSIMFNLIERCNLYLKLRYAKHVRKRYLR